jgi:hypothetical protein
LAARQLNHVTFCSQAKKAKHKTNKPKRLECACGKEENLQTPNQKRKERKETKQPAATATTEEDTNQSNGYDKAKN